MEAGADPDLRHLPWLTLLVDHLDLELVGPTAAGVTLRWTAPPSGIASTACAGPWAGPTAACRAGGVITRTEVMPSASATKPTSMGTVLRSLGTVSLARRTAYMDRPPTLSSAATTAIFVVTSRPYVVSINRSIDPTSRTACSVPVTTSTVTAPVASRENRIGPAPRPSTCAGRRAYAASTTRPPTHRLIAVRCVASTAIARAGDCPERRAPLPRR